MQCVTGGCIHERLKGFRRTWVLACVWGLRTDSSGYAEGGWRVVMSMRSVADLLASRSYKVGHWHRPVEGVFPAAAGLPELCCRLMPTLLRRPTPMCSSRSWLQEQPSDDVFVANSQPRDAFPESSRRLPQSSNAATETVPEVEEPEVEEHPVMPTRDRTVEPTDRGRKDSVGCTFT